MGIESGILYGLLAALGFGLASGISRNVSRAVGGPRSVFLKSLFGIPLILLVLLFIPEQYTIKQFLMIVSIGICGYFPLLSFYKSLQFGDIGILGPIADISNVVTIFLSILILGEAVGWIDGRAIALIIAGAIVLGLNVRALHSGVSIKGVSFAILAACGWGVIYFLFKVLTDLTGPIVTALGIELGVCIASIVHCLIVKEPLSLKIIPKKVLFAGIAMGLLANIGGMALNYGYSMASVSIVTAVFTCKIFVSSLYGVVVYKEKLGFKERISILAIIAGLIILSGIVG